MADRRMISKVISMSEKVGDLKNIFDMLLFTWMIPHTDDFGRLTGSPKKINLMVIPHLEKESSEVEEALVRLHNAGLIRWYEADGDKVVQINDFEKHQSGLHKRTKSKFPDPPEHSEFFPEIPGTSEQFPKIPPELNRTEENLREGNRREEKGTRTEVNSSSGGFKEAYRLFEQEGFGTISPIIAEEIEDLIITYGFNWFERSVKVAVKAGKRSLSYVHGILKRWKASGIQEPWKEDVSSEESQGGTKGVQSGGNTAQSEFAFLDSQNSTGGQEVPLRDM